ncbi:cobyric acid synthase CobQ [Winogradskyella ursingii]|uniref:cobyric acid synthase CobQ n=1 Tax=Winogradskyella ursingii TaxID=2686079 RepID=UPI0015C71E9D|nr:cobyric acid synthase CobQ [Winogradskyella ursingii]
MGKNKAKYYPVGNGDTSLFKISNANIITDCNIREVKDGIYDVKKNLIEELDTRDDKPYTDLFILTHHDNDHCLNFKKHFHTGKISSYDDDDDKIIIDELWVNEYILGDNNISDDSDAGVIRKEVRRRRNLYKNNDRSKDERGNRLVLIGYDDNNEFTNVPQHIPGSTVTQINDTGLKNFEFFIHAPFKADVIDCNAKEDRNMSSIVYQARFYKSNGSDFSCRILHGGDADHYRWATIKEKSEKNDNKDALEWDIFQTPHHCSWTFFNDTPYKDDDKGIDNSEPKQTSIDILNYSLTGAKVVATSKKVVNDKDNPPHYPAKTEYTNVVGDSNFKNTQKFYDDFKKPIVFEIDDYGATLIKASAAAISSGLSKPSRAGRAG